MVVTLTMTKKIFAFSLLPIFLVSALYLCPCKALFASLSHNKSHSCCDKMKDCPLKDQTKGMKSLLSSFSVQEGQNLSNFSSVFFHTISYELNLETTTVHQNFHVTALLPYATSSPPDLFIKHSALLI